jgi:acyl dehydratase
MTTTDTVARLTDESIERMRRRIGIRQRSRRRPHNEVVSYDGIYHFARGNGDMNPLWLEPDYGRASVWGDIVGPPLMASACGIHESVTWTPEEKEAMGGGDPFRGVGQYQSEDAWTLAAPLRAGMRLTTTTHLHDLRVKENSKFAGGVAVYLTFRQVYRLESQPRTVMAICDRSFIYADRDKSGRSEGGEDRYNYSRDYTAEQLAEIDAAYADEYIRGAEVLRHDDVKVGASLGRIVKGPLTVTDIIGFHVGWGFGNLFGIGALRAGYQNRQRVPAFYTLNSHGIPEAVQRCHWDQEQAEVVGQPAPYDYALMRINWAGQLASNWIGDAGQVYRLRSRVTRFNYLGDTTWLSGTVTGKIDDPVAGPLVRVRITGTNQVGTETCVSVADVRLPLADGAVRGPVPLSETAPAQDGPL